MRRKYFLLLSAIITIDILVSCNSNTNAPKNEPVENLTNLVSSTDNSSGGGSSIDNILKEEHYTYSSDIDTTCFSVITYIPKENGIKSINEYAIDNGDISNITIKKGESFVISLPTNALVAYSWNITNSINNSLLKLENTSSIHLDYKPDSDEIVYGESYDRQNFYFSPVNTGTQNINFELSSNANISTDNSKLNINLTILN